MFIMFLIVYKDNKNTLRVQTNFHTSFDLFSLKTILKHSPKIDILNM